jgi:FkbM family methyltransferase
MKRNRPLECRLADGTKVFCRNREEARLIHREVKGYVSRGIRLEKGAVVLDVGANIGLFTIWVGRLLEGDVRVYAFEPVPEIFELLRANAQRFVPAQAKLFPFGLGRESGATAFSYYPNVPAVSRSYPGVTESELRGLKSRFFAELGTLQRYTTAPRLLKWFGLLPPSLQAKVVDWKIRHALQQEKVNCEIRRLSQVIADEAIQRIDLLKIDVEGAELDVLQGLEADDWPKIRQAVIEVHDVPGRVETMSEMLRENGLTCVELQQNTLMRVTGTLTLFARRDRDAG